jgi:hypothetical protein
MDELLGGMEHLRTQLQEHIDLRQESVRVGTKHTHIW